MIPIESCRGVIEVIEEAIQREQQLHDYFWHCSEEVGDFKLKRYFAEIASEEFSHKKHLEDCLAEVKAQREIDDAIMESYEHY